MVALPPIPSVNYYAVVVAAIVSWIIGGVWYMEPVMGKSWMRLIGKTREELRKSGFAKPAIASLIAALIASWVLVLFISYAKVSSAISGAYIGFLVWIGFVITVNAPDYLYVGRPWKLYVINNGYQLIAFLVMGAILGFWT